MNFSTWAPGVAVGHRLHHVNIGVWLETHMHNLHGATMQIQMDFSIIVAPGSAHMPMKQLIGRMGYVSIYLHSSVCWNASTVLYWVNIESVVLKHVFLLKYWEWPWRFYWLAGSKAHKHPGWCLLEAIVQLLNMGCVVNDIMHGSKQWLKSHYDSSHQCVHIAYTTHVWGLYVLSVSATLEQVWMDSPTRKQRSMLSKSLVEASGHDWNQVRRSHHHLLDMKKVVGFVYVV